MSWSCDIVYSPLLRKVRLFPPLTLGNQTAKKSYAGRDAQRPGTYQCKSLQTCKFLQAK